jgi:hypothetical protein
VPLVVKLVQFRNSEVDYVEILFRDAAVHEGDESHADHTQSHHP